MDPATGAPTMVQDPAVTYADPYATSVPDTAYDPYAAPCVALDQPLLLEETERLTRGRPTDAQLGGHALLSERVTCRVEASEDPLTQQGRDLVHDLDLRRR